MPPDTPTSVTQPLSNHPMATKALSAGITVAHSSIFLPSLGALSIGAQSVSNLAMLGNMHPFCTRSMAALFKLAHYRVSVDVRII
jgi:hypothetical protein